MSLCRGALQPRTPPLTTLPALTGFSTNGQFNVTTFERLEKDSMEYGGVGAWMCIPLGTAGVPTKVGPALSSHMYATKNPHPH